MTDYLHVAVNERGSPEGHRECANAINHCLDEITQIDDRLVIAEDILTLLILMMREDAALKGTATEAGNGDIEAWAEGETFSADSLMSVDALTGEFTIATDGAYSISANLVYTGTGQNVQYGMGFRLNGTAQPAFSYNLWTNASAAQSFTGIGQVSLVAGDVINLTKTNGNAMTNISGNARITLIRPA